VAELKAEMPKLNNVRHAVTVKQTTKRNAPMAR
jgi:hypothetical protein